MNEHVDEQKVLKEFQQRFTSAKRAREDFDEKRTMIDKAYEPWTIDWSDEDDGRAHLRTPHIYHQGETLNANMIDPDASVEVTPREYHDADGAKAAGSWLRYALEHDHYVTKLSQIVRMGNRYGLAVAKTLWNRVDDVQEVPAELSMMDKLLGRDPGVQQIVSVIENDPSLVVCDLRDVWWNPGATGMHDVTDFFHRSFTPLHKLQELEADGIYSSISRLGNGGASDDSVGRVYEKPEKKDDRLKALENGVEVIEWYNKRAKKLYTIANNSILIGCRDFPFGHCRRDNELPFAIYRPIPTHYSFEGISPVEPLQALQENVWIMENQRIDAVTLALNPTLLVDRTLKGQGDFTIRAGGRIFVNRPEQIRQLQIDSQAAQGWSEVQAYLGYMQQVSGVSPFIAGSDPSLMGINQNTATGVNTLAGAAGQRIKMFARELEEFVERVARHFLEMAREFMDEQKTVRIVGDGAESWIAFSGQDIPLAFDLRVKGSSDGFANQQKVSDDMNRLNSLSPFEGMPFPDGTQFTVKPLLRQAIEDAGMNPDACFVPTQDSTQAMQDAQVMQAQGDAQQSMMAGDPNMQQMQGQDQMMPPPEARIFENLSFKDLPPDAKAALLESQGLPSDGVMQQAQMDVLERQAKIAKLMADAHQTTDGMQG